MAKVSSAGKTKRPKIDFEKLNRWNSILTVVYLLEAVALWIVATGKTFPVVLSFLGKDSLASQAKGHTVLAPATQHLFEASLVWVLVVSLLVTAGTYFLMGSYLREQYEKLLAKRANPIRWVGYALSSGVMMYAISLVVGVQDSAALAGLFVLTFAGHGLYAVAEMYRQKQEPASKALFWIGTSLLAVVWILVGLTMWATQVYGAGLPAFLYALYPVALALAALIAVNFYLQLRAEGKWADYQYGERIFLAGNFVLQAAVVWIIFAGSLRP